jgi:thiol:disulfide interchange protein
LNEVKLELGVILLAGTVLWLAADSITANVATQLLILLGYGMSAAAWLVFRTRRIVRQLAAGASPADSHQSDVIHPGHETQ